MSKPASTPDRHVIVELRVEDFKRIKTARVRPDGEAVVIGGRNKQGKTSLLDAIQAAMAGGKSAPQQPIRVGAKSSKVVVDLGDIVVTRRFTSKGSHLVVKGADGAALKSPQAVLDRLAGKLSFDPLTFMRAKPSEQANTLRDVAGLDLADLDARIKAAFDERTEVNREVHRLANQAQSLGPVETAPSKPVSLARIMGEMDERRAWNAETEGFARQLADVDRALDALAARASRWISSLQELEAQAKALEVEIEKGNAQYESTAAERDELAAKAGRGYKDTADLDGQIRNAEATNAAVRANDERELVADQLRSAKSSSEACTDEIEDLRAERVQRIADADYPVDGLAVDEDGVLFRGVPLSQASGAEQIRVSAAIGLALNPDLRVLLIRDGSLLDEDSLAQLEAMAADADAQLWIERVGNGDEVSVVIEDGEVVEC